MTQIFRMGVILMTLCAFAGCTTLETLEDPTPERIQQSLDLGDEVRVKATNGKTYGLRVDKVEADSFTGKAVSGKRFKVHYSGIEQIEVRQFSALGTVGGAAAVITVIGVVGLIAALHSLDFHFGFAFCE